MGHQVFPPGRNLGEIPQWSAQNPQCVQLFLGQVGRRSSVCVKYSVLVGCASQDLTYEGFGEVTTRQYDTVASLPINVDAFGSQELVAYETRGQTI